jgi:transcriptional regulator GlxA family with amidase domain
VNPAPLSRHLLRARDLIDAGFAGPLDLTALARAAHVSPRHFSRSFKATFGETPHRYLLSRRLERARHLLRTTELQVGEICLEVGFQSVGSFTATFRRHVGASPTAYRRSNRRPSAADRVPSCFAMAWLRRPENGAIEEDRALAAH